MVWKILLIAVVLIGIAVAAIAIKMFVKKDGQFVKTCGSVDPKTGKKIGCSCGSEDESKCENKSTQV